MEARSAAARLSGLPSRASTAAAMTRRPANAKGRAATATVAATTASPSAASPAAIATDPATV